MQTDQNFVKDVSGQILSQEQKIINDKSISSDLEDNPVISFDENYNTQREQKSDNK
jgi:hypothetical protein